MKEFCLSYDAIKALHEEEALAVCLNRNKDFLEKDPVKDWLEGHHLVGKNIAENISLLLEDNREGLVVSKNMLKYLQSISVEEYKSMMAYSKWQERGANINNSKEERDKDWLDACNFITKYATVSSFEPSHKSVEAYLKNCNKNSELITKRKAYWLHLTYPFQDSIKNYETAKDFVEKFYNLQIIIPAIKGNSIYREKIKNLVFSNPEITNMVEFNIFRIKSIE